MLQDPELRSDIAKAAAQDPGVLDDLVADIADELEAAGYSPGDIIRIKGQLKHYLNLREIIRKASGETLDLKAYEADYDEFEQRGNTWVQLEYATWQKGWTHLIKGGELDGVFDEGLMTKRWLQVSDEVDLEYLPIDGPQLDQLELDPTPGRLRG